RRLQLCRSTEGHTNACGRGPSVHYLLLSDTFCFHESHGWSHVNLLELRRRWSSILSQWHRDLSEQHGCSPGEHLECHPGHCLQLRRRRDLPRHFQRCGQLTHEFACR